MATTPTPAEFRNATSAFADGSELGGTVLLVLMAVALIFAAQYVAPWLATSNVLSRVGRGFAESVVYAVKGAAALAAAGLFALPVWLVLTADPGTRSMVGRYAAYAVIGYGTLVFTGWLADRAVSRFIEAHPDYESWSDIWPEAPDEDEAAEAAD